jgi:hypothetical protein
MFTWFRNWLKRQKQDKGFHPSWILLVVLTTALIGAIVWLPAEWMAKSEYKRLPPALHAPSSGPGGSAPRESVPWGGGMPAIDQAPRDGPRLIRVELVPGGAGALAAGDTSPVSNT